MFCRIAKVSVIAVVVASTAIGPAAAASGSVSVAVTASTQATIGASYGSGSNIACTVGSNVTGIVACGAAAILTGTIRTTKSTGGAGVSLSGATITGSGGATIAPSALRLTCTGGLTGAPAFAGTAGTPANAVPLATTAVPCMTWTGTVVAAYSVSVSLSIDAALVPSDTYTNGSFTATATAG